MLRVFLAGEGSDELGGFAREPAYRPIPHEPGLVEALLRRVRVDGWQVVDAVPWRRIVKLKVGKGMHGAERRNVLGFVLMASEAGCTVAAFVRDRDRDPERAAAIESAIDECSARFSAVRVIGGVAVEAIEAWLLAINGDLRSEEHSDPKNLLGIAGLHAKIAIVDSADLDHLPRDAVSLGAWLGRARTTLARD